MKKLITIGILLTLVSCVSIPERRIIERHVDNIPTVEKDLMERKMDCIARFHKLGKKHMNQMSSCKFSFEME